MTLDEFIKEDLADVPVRVKLKDGSTIYFRCDGENGKKLTGMVFGADVFLPFEDVDSIDVLSESEYNIHAKNHEAYWYR